MNVQQSGQNFGFEDAAPTDTTSTGFRLALGQTIHSNDVELVEAPTFEALFERICAAPSTSEGSGPYVCAPMRGGIRKRRNADPTRVLVLDFDELSPHSESNLRAAIAEMGVSCVVWTTRSHSVDSPRIRVLVELSRSVSIDEYRHAHAAFVGRVQRIADCEIAVDSTSASSFQPQFVPLKSSTVTRLTGSGRRAYDVDGALKAAECLSDEAAGFHLVAEPSGGVLDDDPIVAAAREQGLNPTHVKAGTIGVDCPWANEHTSDSNLSSSAILLPNFDGRQRHGFKCFHAHCANRSIRDLRAWLGMTAENDGDDHAPLGLRPISEEWLDVALPPTRFVVDGWIPEGSVGLLVAEGGTGKTLLSLRMAMAIAGGCSFLGAPTSAGTAVVLALEDPTDVLRRRVKALFDAESGGAWMLNPAGEGEFTSRRLLRKRLMRRFVCRSLVGSELYLIKTGDGGVTQGDQISALIAELRALDDVKLLVLDPLSRLHGLEENDSSVGTALINTAERIANEVGCAVLITHHTGKGNARDRVADPYAARGSSALADAARTVLRLMKAEVNAAHNYEGITAADLEKGAILNLIHAKSNYGPLQDTLWLRKDGPGIRHFSPLPKNAFQSRWATFMAWWSTKMAPNPVYRNGLAERRGEIWGQGVTKAEVVAFVQQAIDEARLRATDAVGAKNPAAKALLPVTGE